MSVSAAAAVQTASARQPIPFKPAAGDELAGGSVLLAVLLLALAAVAVLAGLKRRGPLSPRGGQQRVQVLETVRLGPGASLSVVAFGGKELLLAHSAQGVQQLAETPAGGQA